MEAKVSSIMRSSGLAIAALFALFMIPLVAMAAVLQPVPDGDLGQLLLQLIVNWKTLGWLGAGPIIVMALAEVVKLFRLKERKKEWNRLIVTSLAIAYGVFLGLSQPGMTWPTVLISILITGGGASALYEAIKGVIKIKKPKAAVQTLAVMALLGAGFSGCTAFPIDTAMAADIGGEPTVLFDGCGSRIHKGLLGIQLMEGARPNCELRFLAPPVKCDRESCAGFQFRRADGTAGFGLGVPKGQTEVRFKLSDVLEHDRPLTLEDESVLLVHAGYYYKNQDGLEELARTKGHLHLIVLKEGYKPMPCGAPEVAWSFEARPGCEAQVSTAGRTALCGSGCGG